MSKTVVFFLCSTLCFSCYDTNLNCKNCKIGTFEFEALINGKKEKTIFRRISDSIEISTFRGKKDTSLLKWVSPCEYISRKINPKTIIERKAIRFKILSTNKKGYFFEYGLVGDIKNIKRGFAKRVKKL